MRGTLQERFDAKWEAEPTTGCWLWTASTRVPSPRRGSAAYGQIGIGGKRVEYAHRVSWQLHRGDIPEGQCVLHHCDTPLCVNPAHLFLGTHQDNVADQVAKGRQICKLDAARAYAIYHSPLSRKQLAEEYGVSVVTIRSILFKNSWLSIHPD